ncbi:MAG: hypothetical protein ACT4TC_11635 [Myxococcaceae bacterium]
MNAKTVLTAGLLVCSWATAQDAVAPPAPAADAPLAETPPAPGMRVRWGVTGGFGYFAPASAVDFGVNGRIGVQLSQLLGLYADIGYVAGIGFGGSVSNSGAAVSVSGVGFWHLAPMVEADIGNVFFVAGGPMIGGGGWAQVQQTADASGNATQNAIAAGGFLYGLNARTGFTFGTVQPSGRHGGFTLALDFKMIAARVTSASQSAGAGGASQAITTGSTVVGFTPMLMLGYDAK